MDSRLKTNFLKGNTFQGCKRELSDFFASFLKCESTFEAIRRCRTDSEQKYQLFFTCKILNLKSFLFQLEVQIQYFACEKSWYFYFFAQNQSGAFFFGYDATNALSYGTQKARSPKNVKKPQT